MNAEMQEDEDRLKRLMREIIEKWPQYGVTIILKAERLVIHEDADAIAAWAEKRQKN